MADNSSNGRMMTFEEFVQAVIKIPGTAILELQRNHDICVDTEIENIKRYLYEEYCKNFTPPPEDIALEHDLDVAATPFTEQLDLKRGTPFTVEEFANILSGLLMPDTINYTYEEYLLDFEYALQMFKEEERFKQLCAAYDLYASGHATVEYHDNGIKYNAIKYTLIADKPVGVDLPVNHVGDTVTFVIYGDPVDEYQAYVDPRQTVLEVLEVIDTAVTPTAPPLKLKEVLNVQMVDVPVHEKAVKKALDQK